ncbi:Major Facilitator Superfamily protein [Promicromonospora umidemergens]|uniref:MFS transporter n=1 Tax=Promicromonospora umidemergens TaxID=629679 RepID=A0ABP8WYD7_9MICO|nr:MFS transporter [Promicromonospora umidemergens]MCP2285524.1 Major Facilitator Superfamily protein [Promicromonospora umidemergens]
METRPTPTTPPVEAAADGGRRTVVTLMIALLSACLAFQLNASMLSPALVTMERELHATGAQIAATQTAFFTAAALFTLFLPRLGDLVGRRRVLVGMLLAMAVGCVIAALATNVTVLFLGRLLQGASGPVVPLCLVMLRVVVSEPRTYGTLMGVVTAVNGGIAGVDALLGGYLATNHGFASIFWTMAAVAIVSALVVRFLAPESTASDRPRMDWAGSLLLVVSVGAMLVAVNELGKLGAANTVLVAILVVVSVASFAWFWRTESKGRHPLVSIPQLKERATWALVSTSLLTLCGIFAIMNGIVPALAQDSALGLRMSAEEVSWWVLMPYALAGLLMGPISGRLAATLGYRTMLQIGVGGTIVGLVLLALNVGSESRVVLLGLSVAVGVTYAGIANIMLNGLGVTLSPKARPGSLPGLNTGGINLGAGVSFVVIYAVQTAFASTPGGPSAGYVASLLTGALILVGALLMSLRIPRPVEAEVQR